MPGIPLEERVMPGVLVEGERSEVPVPPDGHTMGAGGPPNRLRVPCDGRCHVGRVPRTPGALVSSRAFYRLDSPSKSEAIPRD